ncbi:NAD(P)H-quinone oxidoreductase [Propionibacteriaceae bacterium Y2011]
MRETMMGAIAVGDEDGPDALVWGEAVRPSPAADEVLVQVVAAGVNRADVMQRQGHYPPPDGASEILGLECSGTVVEVGADVTGWQVGDPCVALLSGGGYAEYVAVPAGQLLPPPPGIDLVTAGGVVEVAATVVANLSRWPGGPATGAGLTAGEVFLVHGGAGGIGTFAIQYAKQLGATVITTAGSADKVDHCRSFGADHVLRYDIPRDEADDWVSRVHDLGGVDVVLDPIGAKYLADHVRLLKRGGRIVTIGLQGGRKGELDLAGLLARNGSISAAGLRGRPVSEKSAICARVHDQVWPMLGSDAIRTTPTTTIPLAEAARAHALFDSDDTVGKIVLTTAAAVGHGAA